MITKEKDITAIASTVIPVMTLMAFLDFLEKIYLFAMKKGKFNSVQK